MDLAKFFMKHGKPKYAIEMIEHELKEAKYALKHGMMPTHEIIPETVNDGEFKRIYEENIKDTFPDELASAGIKLMDFADSYSINLHDFIKMHSRYCDLMNKGTSTIVTYVKPNMMYGML